MASKEVAPFHFRDGNDDKTQFINKALPQEGAVREAAAA